MPDFEKNVLLFLTILNFESNTRCKNKRKRVNKSDISVLIKNSDLEK